MIPRRFLAGAGVSMSLLVVAGGMGARRWAEHHVAHYTGDQARTVSCSLCHFAARGGTLSDRVLRPRYRTPLDLAVCPDGRIYATAQEAGTLLEIDARRRVVLREIPVGRGPHHVAVDAGCATAYVSNSDDDTVSVVDLSRGSEVAAVGVGSGPAGVALSPDGATLYVADSRGGDISVVDTAGLSERTRLAGSSAPYGAAFAPDGSRVLVGSQLAQPARAPEPPHSEVTVVDARRGRIESRLELADAHLLDGIAFTPDGSTALVVAVRPKNLLPVLQVERGWMMTNGLAVIDLAGGRAVQVPLDEPDRFFADPSDVVVSPDGRTAFVSHGGVDLVSVIDLEALRRLLAESSPADLERLADRLSMSGRYVIRRVPTGSNPRGLALSPDGRTLYVAERLDDRIGVIDVERLERVGGIELNASRHETMRRRGEKLFNSAAFTLQSQFSCRSCHPENHMDRLQYDFEPDGLGRNLVDNRTLLGLRGTAPFKWNGRNTSLYMQCGIRFARFLMRSEPFPAEDLAALVAFLDALEPTRDARREGGGGPTAAQARGKAVFERVTRRDGTPIALKDRCLTCHPAPRYTDLRISDVGSASPTDSERAFDTPGLESLRLSAPYLHDGKAMSLEEIWTLYSPDDTHGVTSDLGKDGLNDLVEYLKTL